MIRKGLIGFCLLLLVFHLSHVTGDNSQQDISNDKGNLI